MSLRVARRRSHAAEYSRAFAATGGVIPPAVRTPADTNFTHYTVRFDDAVREVAESRRL